MYPRTRELLGHLFSIGMDVMSSTISTRTSAITVQLGDCVGQQYVDADAAEWWQQSGFTSRPAAPRTNDLGQPLGEPGCQVLAIRHSHHDMAFAVRDLRWASINADLDYGDSCLHGCGPAISPSNGRVVARKTGAVEVRSQTGIDLGGASTDHVSLASRVDANFANIKAAAESALAAAVPEDGGKAAFTAFISALSSPTVASALVKCT